MNILPKKNWHVRKKENIARVRRDEAEAAEKEREKERRVKLAEQEARVAFLRKKARERDGDDLNDISLPTKQESKIEADIFTTTGNINFFKEAEAGETKTGTNEEYEEEKKAEKEAYEKKIGLLTYLGQDTLEATGKTAWFMQRDHIITKKSSGINQENGDEEIGLKSKTKLDPLNEIMKHTHTKIYPKIESTNVFDVPPSSGKISKPKTKNLCRKDKRHKKGKHKKRKREHGFSSDSETGSKKRKKKKHYSKKSKKKRRRRECSSEEHDAEDSGEEKQKQLAKLREERLKREARERKREERLLAGKNPDIDEKQGKLNLPYNQKYNSQFNPHLAKQNQDRNTTNTTQSTLQAGVKYWIN